jgi:hypothetical protein
MNDRQRRQFEMLVRVREFGESNAPLFAALPVAQQTFAAVSAATASLLAINMKKMSASTAARADRRTDARDALLTLLQQVVRLAKNLRAEGRAIGGISPPVSRSDVSLIIAGRHCAECAAAAEPEFSGHGLSPAHILAVTEAFELAVQQQDRSRSAHIAAKAEMRELIASALRAVRRLDLIVETTFAHDVAAQWAQARHVERDPQRRGPETPQQAERL